MSDGELRFDDVYVAFSQARVLEGLSMTVGPGEIVGLAGRNGAGKTTTLRAVSGLASVNRGSITLDGRPLPKSPEGVARRGVAHVPEGRGIFPDLTVDQNILLGVLVKSKDTASIRGTLEEKFPAIARLREQKAGRLSGGEQQMLALVRGLVSHPRFLLVDEMSLGLSPRALRTAIESLVEIGRSMNIGMLVVDQNSRMLHEHCDRVYLLRDGKAELWDDDTNIESVYFE
jgi:branched-chain amino acid transport system ATP-binding protein